MRVVILPKMKYRIPAVYKKNAYRARTGPKCCNIGCGSNYKKAGTKRGLA